MYGSYEAPPSQIRVVIKVMYHKRYAAGFKVHKFEKVYWKC